MTDSLFSGFMELMEGVSCFEAVLPVTDLSSIMGSLSASLFSKSVLDDLDSFGIARLQPLKNRGARHMNARIHFINM